MSNFEDYFYSLVNPPEKAKKRACLKCGHLHVTTKGKRLCAYCKRNHTGAGARATMIYPDKMFGGE